MCDLLRINWHSNWIKNCSWILTYYRFITLPFVVFVVGISDQEIHISKKQNIIKIMVSGNFSVGFILHAPSIMYLLWRHSYVLFSRCRQTCSCNSRTRYYVLQHSIRYRCWLGIVAVKGVYWLAVQLILNREISFVASKLWWPSG